MALGGDWARKGGDSQFSDSPPSLSSLDHWAEGSLKRSVTSEGGRAAVATSSRFMKADCTFAGGGLLFGLIVLWWIQV